MDAMISWEDKITIRRESVGEYVEGEYVRGSDETFEAMANVQPNGFNQTISDPQGERITDFIKIYTNEELRPPRDSQKADKIIYNDDWYEIFQVRKYTQLSLPHYHGIAVRINNEDQEEER